LEDVPDPVGANSVGDARSELYSPTELPSAFIAPKDLNPI
jgi:hypothetical protein